MCRRVLASDSSARARRSFGRRGNAAGGFLSGFVPGVLRRLARGLLDAVCFVFTETAQASGLHLECPLLPQAALGCKPIPTANSRRQGARQALNTRALL